LAKSTQELSQMGVGILLLSYLERTEGRGKLYPGSGFKKTVEKHRSAAGRKEKTSFIIVDAQSVKNTETAEQKGYDAGKKVSGIKRHIAVDTEGLPHAITITTANVSDKAGAKQMVKEYDESLNEVANVLVDGSYAGSAFSEFIADTLDATVEVARRSELHTFAVIPKRCVVERSFAWVDRCRRLWKNCERKLSTSLAMVQLAFISLILRRL
jgi:transposase